MTRLTCNDVSLGYDHNVVVENLSFTLEEEDYLCVIGENGTGKSTLMKGILGLHPPLRGTITWGEGLSQRDVGYLPQQTAAQKDFPASVEEIVRSGCQARCGLRPFYNKEEKKLADEKMERMRITEFRKRPYRALSGGQQQRVLLARALCSSQKILLLDEPVSGLDAKVTAELYDTIAELHKEGMSIIMISHDMESAVSYASKILQLGKSIFWGTKEEYQIKEGKT